MSRTVIDISPSQDRAGNISVSFKLSEPPDTYPGADTFVPLTCSAQDAEFVAISSKQLQKDAVRLAGMRLCNNIYSQSAVGQAIQAAIARAKQEKDFVAPIYLLLREGTQALEGLPWETMWDPHEGFLTLKESWPIGRMSGGQASDPIERPLNLPIRVLAFLAATRIEAQPEWDALYTALVAAEVPVALKVYICESELEDHIKAQSQDPNINVEIAYLPFPFDFADIIPNADFSPNIIHFFCHGSSEDGPSLLLSTMTDWEHGESSVVLGPDEFGRIPGWDSHLWLVTLNCCESAAAEQELSSFARTLVTTIKVPAVVAMRETVKVEDANVFCGTFYKALLREIKQSLASVEKFSEIEWVRALYEPRYALCKTYAAGVLPVKAAADSKEWTLPVIYVRSPHFKLRAVSSQSLMSKQDQAMLDMIQQVLADLPPDLPAEVRDPIQKKIAELKTSLFATQ